MIKDTPLTRYKRKTFTLTGLAMRLGTPVNLQNHVLRFAIANRNTMIRVLTVTTGNGITQDSNGRFTVTIPANTMGPNTFPMNDYWWELDAQINGNPSDTVGLARGPFTFKPSPFEV